MKFVIRYVMDTCPQDIAFFNQFVDKGLVDRLNNVVNSDFAHVTYTEAVDILKRITINLNIRWSGAPTYRLSMKSTSRSRSLESRCL